MPLQKRPFRKIGKCANPDCGREFIRKHRNQQYCCLSCASRHNKMKQIGSRRKVNYKPKFCEWCGTLFTPTKSGQKYCHSKCAKEAARDKASKRLYKKIHPDQQTPTPKPQPKPIKKTPAATMDEVLAYMKEYNCQYRKAVQALDGNRY